MAKATKQTAKQTKATRKPQTRKPSMMAVAFEMIRNGSTNEQVTAKLIRDHKLPKAHKHYASWFRAALVRKLTAEGGNSKLVKKIQASAHAAPKAKATKKAPAAAPAVA